MPWLKINVAQWYIEVCTFFLNNKNMSRLFSFLFLLKPVLLVIPGDQSLPLFWQLAHTYKGLSSKCAHFSVCVSFSLLCEFSIYSRGLQLVVWGASVMVGGGCSTADSLKSKHTSKPCILGTSLHDLCCIPGENVKWWLNPSFMTDTSDVLQGLAGSI